MESAERLHVRSQYNHLFMHRQHIFLKGQHCLCPSLPKFRKACLAASLHSGTCTDILRGSGPKQKGALRGDRSAEITFSGQGVKSFGLNHVQTSRPYWFSLFFGTFAKEHKHFEGIYQAFYITILFSNFDGYQCRFSLMYFHCEILAVVLQQHAIMVQ